jgi:biopolymer transport protein ExbD
MTHKRKKLQGSSSQGVQLGLIITPMLDMSFQLLAFFIMTYHPSALEGHIPGSLVPPEDFAKKSKDNNPVPQENPLSVPEEELLPELQESITVKIKSIAKGQETGALVEGSPAQIFLKTPQETEPQLIADPTQIFTKDPVKDAMVILDSKLKDMIAKGATKKTNLKIAADGDLRQQYVMQVYDTCKKAGFDKIHFVPPPVLNTKISTR